MIKRSVLSWRLAVCVSLLAVAASAYAQSSSTFVFDVKQEFSAANKPLPAGRYELSLIGNAFTVQGPSGRVIVPVLQRLARFETSAKSSEARLVFDKLDTGEQMLSEIWLPGEDGYLVCTLEKAHHHVIMNAQKKK
jgi:hypothetical protein